MRAICEEVLRYVASYVARRNEQSAAACLLSSRLASLRLPGPVPCAKCNRCRFDLTSQENLSVSRAERPGPCCSNGGEEPPRQSSTSSKLSRAWGREDRAGGDPSLPPSPTKLISPPRRPDGKWQARGSENDLFDVTALCSLVRAEYYVVCGRLKGRCSGPSDSASCSAGDSYLLECRALFYLFWCMF